MFGMVDNKKASYSYFSNQAKKYLEQESKLLESELGMLKELTSKTSIGFKRAEEIFETIKATEQGELLNMLALAVLTMIATANCDLEAIKTYEAVCYTEEQLKK